MKVAFSLCILVFLLFGTGCAHLGVDVHVFNRDCLQQVDFQRAKALDRSASLRAFALSDRYRLALTTLRVDVQNIALKLKCVDGLNDPRDYCLEEKYVTKGIFTSAIISRIEELFAEADAKYQLGIEQTDAGENAPRADTKIRMKHYALALEYFYQGDEVLRNMRAAVKKELDNQLPQETEAALNSSAPFLDKVQQVSQKLAQGAGLFDDHLASAVVTADKSCWDAEYNDAGAWGFFGNSDIAIKMEASGDYSIKGVRLDAAEVTKATFGAVRQGIAIAAAAYGVPLPTAQRADGSTSALAISELDSITNAQQETELRARFSKMAMWGLLEAMVQRREEFENTKTRQKTFESLQSIFAIYRPQLSGDTN